MQYATFGCITYEEQCKSCCETGIEPDEPLGDDCEMGVVDTLPRLGWDLPKCPGCGGPMQLIERLEPVPG
jgi:hypothetical protein